MFEYIATISTPMGLRLASAGFESQEAARKWVDVVFDDTTHAGRWEIARKGEVVSKFQLRA